MEQCRKFKKLLMCLLMLSVMCSTMLYAQSCSGSSGGVPPAGTLAAIFYRITMQMSSFAKLITALSYVAGLGFAVASLFKFKAHQNNPQQITIGQPIALMLVAVCLLYMPTFFDLAGTTVFGSNKASAGVCGTQDINLSTFQ